MNFKTVIMMLDNPLSPRGIAKNAVIPPCEADQEKIMIRLRRGEDPNEYFQDLSRRSVSERRGEKFIMLSSIGNRNSTRSTPRCTGG